MFRFFLDGTKGKAAGAGAGRAVSNSQSNKVCFAGIGKSRIDFYRGVNLLPRLIDFHQFRGRVNGGEQDGFAVLVLFGFERGNVAQCRESAVGIQATDMLQPNARTVFSGVVILRHLFELFAADVAAVNGCAFGGDNVVFQGMLRGW